MKPTAADHGDRPTVAVVGAVQAAISLGYFSAMAHIVVHLQDGLGLAAGLIGLVLALRNLVQHTLSLPVGALVDVLGPGQAGVLACLVRAAGFALLGTVSSPPGLISAAVLLGAGGALFHPAAQSLLASLTERRRTRGYAAYMMTLQAAAVLGPALGLALLNIGYWLVALTAAALWCFAAALFPLARHAPRYPAETGVVTGVPAALRDRVFLWFAAVTTPTVLLTAQAPVVVPLGGADATAVTVFCCVLAMTSAAAQPWCATRAERPAVLRAGLLDAGGGYLLLALGAAAALPGLLAAAALHGLADGLLQPAMFQTTARLAPRSRFGTYLGVRTFFSGLLAFAGGAAVGRLFDHGPRGATAALVALALLACATAAAARRARTLISAGWPPWRSRSEARPSGCPLASRARLNWPVWVNNLCFIWQYPIIYDSDTAHICSNPGGQSPASSERRSDPGLPGSSGRRTISQSVEPIANLIRWSLPYVL
ncbi:MFS transporter [Actinomadura atramentaria]|uniref:MFS transporter n=1 Tax=Actinomadura atramentaria TaxID=1990 RepID=UPI000366EC9D|nr:MFS transporter [Actinomadura atramentaria]